MENTIPELKQLKKWAAPVELYHKITALLGLSFSPAVIVKCFLLNL